MTFEEVDEKVKKAELGGLFKKVTPKGCRAISYNDKNFKYPLTKQEWDEYCSELWTLLHAVARKEIDPKWDWLKFRNEEDYFAGSYSSQLPFWLLAINMLHNDKLKYTQVLHTIK